uniref:Transmembrane protein 144b n=1 Tax=Sphaeramia orbicularis TaxID=375764 RepID=A0A672ZII3_9TELE
MEQDTIILVRFIYLSLLSCCLLIHGVQDGWHIKPEVYDFAFNSTNVTHFVYGVAANAVAVLLYGSNYVPVKRIETGDGMFFQWVNCAAIWLVSMVGDLMLHSPKFYPLAMLGGVIWATGNIAVVPVLKASGLGLGILNYSLTLSKAKWRIRRGVFLFCRFGWFGIAVPEVSRPVLNDCGAGLCMASGFIFFFVKTNAQLHPYSESTPLLFDRVSILLNMFLLISSQEHIGCLLAVVSGLLYGSSFVPILYIKSHSSSPDSVFYGASVYDLDYVYAQCSGIFLTSTIYFTIYCCAMNNKPRVYSRAVLPGLLSGLMWALATYCWFLANNYLSAVNTFPIVSAVSTSCPDS